MCLGFEPERHRKKYILVFVLLQFQMLAGAVYLFYYTTQAKRLAQIDMSSLNQVLETGTSSHSSRSSLLSLHVKGNLKTYLSGCGKGLKKGASTKANSRSRQLRHSVSTMLLARRQALVSINSYVRRSTLRLQSCRQSLWNNISVAAEEDFLSNT